MQNLDMKNGRLAGDFHDDADGTLGLEVPEFSHEVKKPYKVQQTIEVEHFGYSAPTEQTTYDGAGAVHMNQF